MSAGPELERQAMDAFQAGRVGEAIEAFRHAREMYRQQGDVSKAAEMANNACVALLQAGRAAEALESVQGTPETFASQGDELMSAKAYGNLASALEATGDRTGAEAAYRKAVDLLGKLGDTESQSQTLRALSELQLRRGQTFDAVVSMQSAVEVGERRSLKDRFLRWLIQLPFRIQGR